MTTNLSTRPFSGIQYIENPSQNELRRLALKHTPDIVETAQGSLMKVSRNKNRVAKFTYLIARPGFETGFSMQTIEPAKAEALIAKQMAYIKEKNTLIAIDGFLGLGKRAVGVEWLYTLEGANIAGMQQVLSFPPSAQLKAGETFKPDLRIVYTPNCFVDEMPGKQAVLVDLANQTTYIMGPDYFGESKKGALRMLNWLVYQQGGMVLHAGAKAVHMNGSNQSVTIMGESGTGKTTTTFSQQGTLTQPIQDDMVSIWPKGEISVTENGCFAKTENLSFESEPVIFDASMDSKAWLENVYVDLKTKKIDFCKTTLSPAEVQSYQTFFLDTCVTSKADLEKNMADYVSGKITSEACINEAGVPKEGWDFVIWSQNGRSIVPLSTIKNAPDLHSIPLLKSMIILNRDEGMDAAVPGLIRFVSPEQAAAYFMLGETSLTSAAGKERGKLRSPFTQPFFPGKHSLQPTRFKELVATMPGIGLWLMNTGCVGGDAKGVKEGKALKVKIKHSSAILENLLGGKIVFKKDPDFGYDIVDTAHPANRDFVAQVPAEILEPKLFYEKQGRQAEYQTWVKQMREERRAFLQKHQVDHAIIETL